MVTLGAQVCVLARSAIKGLTTLMKAESSLTESGVNVSFAGNQ